MGKCLADHSGDQPGAVLASDPLDRADGTAIRYVNIGCADGTRDASASPQQVAAQQQQPKTQPRRKVAQPTPATMTPPSLTLQLELIPDVPTTLGDIAMPEVQLAAVAPLPSIFDSDALDQPLTPLSQSPFIYPLRAKRLGIEGWVKVKLLISTSGDVEQVHILEAQPQEMFESTVERGIRRWRFTPGTVQGEPVRSWVITTIRFELES